MEGILDLGAWAIQTTWDADFSGGAGLGFCGVLKGKGARLLMVGLNVQCRLLGSSKRKSWIREVGCYILWTAFWKAHDDSA